MTRRLTSHFKCSVGLRVPMWIIRTPHPAPWNIYGSVAVWVLIFLRRKPRVDPDHAALYILSGPLASHPYLPASLPAYGRIGLPPGLQQGSASVLPIRAWLHRCWNFDALDCGAHRYTKYLSIKVRRKSPVRMYNRDLGKSGWLIELKRF